MKTLFSVISIMLIMMFAVPVTAVEDGVYRYPVQPGSQEWIDMGTTQARVQALQIPGEILSEMPTKMLVQACLDYPFINEVWAYGNSPQESFNLLAESFNGFRELLNRGDAAEQLVEAYKQLNPANVRKEWSLYEQGKYSLRIAGTELLLAQEGVLAVLKADRALLKKATAFLKAKRNRSDVYGTSTMLTTALLMGRVMQKEKTLNHVFRRKVSELTELQDFLKRGKTPHAQAILDEITTEAEQVSLHHE